MATEAQKRAKKKYRERKVSEGGYKSLLLEFYDADMGLYEYLQTQKPTTTYIKELIRKDMDERRDH